MPLSTFVMSVLVSFFEDIIFSISCRIQNKVSFCVTAHVLTANPNICVNYFMNTNHLVSFARPLTVLLSDYFYSLITNTKTFGELCPSSSLAHDREKSPSLTFAPHSSSDPRQFQFPCVKTKSHGQHLFAYQGPTVWNKHPYNIRHSSPISSKLL